MSDIALLKKQIQRERAARKAAEKILEDKALELYKANVALKELNSSLETEVEKRSKSLTESEKKYRMLVENAQDMIYNVDEHGRFTFTNAVSVEIMGFSQAELINQKFYEMMPENFKPFAKKYFETFKKAKIESDYQEFRAIKKNGEDIWLGQNIKRIDLETGDFYFNVVARDITDRKKLETQLVTARLEAEEAQEAEKLFLANMSHEIRTPLNAIIGMSHLLDDTHLNHTQRDYIKTLLSSAGILKALISDVLDISKIDSGSIELSPKPLNLNTLGSQLINIQKMSSNKAKVDYQLQCSEQLNTLVMIDERLISQVLVNLLGNASKFTEEGNITLSMDLIEASEQHLDIEIRVTDTGIGISKENLHHIFSKFKQANNEVHVKYGGTGLGLAISKKLVHLLGAELAVDSELGKGSSFHFQLKVEKAAQPIPTKRIKNGDTVLKENIKVAVVEDNVMNQKYIESIFSKWKIEYSLYHNGKEALRDLNTIPMDIILMDIEMPLMDGIETSQNIRNVSGPNQDTPIIALTASSFLSKKKEALSAGMTDFLSKPFIPNELKAMMRKYVNLNEKEVKTQQNFQYSKDLDEDYLHLAYGDDHAYALEMFSTFDEIILDEMAALKKEVSLDDQLKAKAILHKIKPMFTMVGLKSFTEEIAAIELKLAQSESTELMEWYDSFENNLSTKLNIIKEQISNLEACLSH